jgi:dienelactone hydrolase
MAISTRPAHEPKEWGDVAVPNIRSLEQWVRLVLLALGVLPSALACVRSSSPRLVVPSSPVLRGDPVNVRADGLAPGARVTLKAAGKDQHGQEWTSMAVFEADAGGAVVLARDAPVSGSWTGAGREGPFWSMALDPAAANVTPMVSIDDVALTLLDASGAVLGQGAVVFAGQVGVAEVTATGPVVGSLYVPVAKGSPAPALIVLGGSEGGCRKDLAALLASRLGAPVLALAYFGVQGSPLPTALQEIPLEYFVGAMDWLDARPEVKPGSHVVLGISRGAELALLLGATYPERIRGVLANVPSAVAWVGEGPDRGASSWTFQGAQVPFVPYVWSDELLARLQAAMRSGAPFAFREVHEYALAHAAPERVASATIPVERISGPVMLLGSGADGVWPSDDFVGRIVSRLTASRFPFPATSFTYPSAGHLIQDGYQPTTLTRLRVRSAHITMELGGTPEGAAAANADSWPKVIAFLESALRSARER